MHPSKLGVGMGPASSRNARKDSLPPKIGALVTFHRYSHSSLPQGQVTMNTKRMKSEDNAMTAPAAQVQLGDTPNGDPLAGLALLRNGRGMVQQVLVASLNAARLLLAEADDDAAPDTGGGGECESLHDHDTYPVYTEL